MTAALTFDNTLADSGPLGINTTGTGYSYSASGQHNQGLSLFGSLSYIQATGLTLLGTADQPYSMAIWINPTVVAGGTIIHVSGSPNGMNWCIPMLGFSNTGRIGGQSWNGNLISISGSFVAANVWTHLVLTYGPTNGIRLWVNGIQSGSGSGSFTYSAAGSPVVVTLGSSLSGTGRCATNTVTVGQYRGYMDDFQLYSRELSASDIFALANS